MKLDSSISAVVTGGASGLGAGNGACAGREGREGRHLRHAEGKGRGRCQAEIGGVFCEVNVTSDESVDAGFAKARAAIGQERILVNCAGTGNAIKTASRSKEDRLDQALPARSLQHGSSRSTWSAPSAASPSRQRA
jgi:NAD(P)-dependent dehydrogenase (short-subunit alcohol dehydrogenase family)